MLLNYKQTGSGPNLILMHGLFGSLENLNVIAKTLSEHFTVYNVDLRNHGKSFHSDDMSYPHMAGDIKALLEHLNIDKAHVVGHSMGGKVAMQFASSFNHHVNKLVVLDIAPVTYPPRHDEIIVGLNKVSAHTNVLNRTQADEILSEHIEIPGVRQFLLKSLAKNAAGALSWRFNLPVIANAYSNIVANITSASPCQCDTLFIKGNNSDYILAEHREAIVKAFPKATAKVIHGVGHWLHAEKPAAVNKSILDFLQ
ncbi:acyl-CoA esterase [Pseudoalteromonas sp. MSK9-3]|uniref:alpha/beta fold hydrolase n=1 Tax=Pseudoalteromonas sp. MSK9-3 TaxID=1897633 RepID=UPI000E6C4DD8|nr:alpha/beta fold hydrolase [Pseudoalteromonas sp. MSK9-3]RJE77447.1 acyl-CoA esterase [Pseudoalteromonas sp. MSK9-3]